MPTIRCVKAGRMLRWFWQCLKHENNWGELFEFYCLLINYDVIFIAGDLILNTADLLDKLMDISEALTVTWSTAELVLCCLEAGKQVG